MGLSDISFLGATNTTVLLQSILDRFPVLLRGVWEHHVRPRTGTKVELQLVTANRKIPQPPTPVSLERKPLAEAMLRFLVFIPVHIAHFRELPSVSFS